MSEMNIGGSLANAMGEADVENKYNTKLTPDQKKRFLLVSTNPVVSIIVFVFIGYLLYSVNPFSLFFLLLVPIIELISRRLDEKKVKELDEIMRKAAQTKSLTFGDTIIDLEKE